MISAHISTREIACKCGCGFEIIEREIVRRFEAIRTKCAVHIGYEIPVFILSGCRCEAHNIAVGGSKRSRHIKGQAMDLKCPNMMLFKDFVRICKDVMQHFGGLGVYTEGNFVHIDCRTEEIARWHD